MAILNKLRSNWGLTELLEDIWKWLDNQLAAISVSGSYNDLSNKIQHSAIAITSNSDSISTSTVSPVMVVPAELDGWNIEKALIGFTTSGPSGTTSIDIEKKSGGTVSTVSSISIAYDDADAYNEITGIATSVAKGDKLYINVTSAADSMTGVSITLTFNSV